MSLPTGKALGLDGLSVEFYRACVDELSPFFLELFMESLDRGQLPTSLTEALISIISKSNKDSLDCKNYRPINLINCDCKILSKILASRLDNVMTPLTHQDQVGFIRSCSASDNKMSLCKPLPPMHLLTTKLPYEFQKHPIVSFLQHV